MRGASTLRRLPKPTACSTIVRRESLVRKNPNYFDPAVRKCLSSPLSVEGLVYARAHRQGPECQDRGPAFQRRSTSGRAGGENERLRKLQRVHPGGNPERTEWARGDDRHRGTNCRGV